LGNRKGIRLVKKLGVGLLVVTFDHSFANLTAPVVDTTSLAPIKPANLGSPGKMAVKTERERERERQLL